MKVPRLLGGVVGLAVVATAAPGPAQSRYVTDCPAADPQARGAAHCVVTLMAALGPKFAPDVLSPSLYQVASSGRGIEFSPQFTIPEEAKGALAFSEEDDSVANYLVLGQQECEFSSAGYYQQMSAEALAIKSSPARPWCGASLLTAEVVGTQSDGNPFLHLASPMTATFPLGRGRRECSPFLGPRQANDYLIVTLSQTTEGNTVVHKLQMDPVPYAEPGEYYQPPGVACGSQDNPFHVSSTVLYAVPDHQNQWAQRMWSSQCHLGRFSTPVTMFGMTQYKWTEPDPANPIACRFVYGTEPCAL